MFETKKQKKLEDRLEERIGKHDFFDYCNCFLFSCKNQFEILVRSSESSWCWQLIESMYETAGYIEPTRF